MVVNKAAAVSLSSDLLRLIREELDRNGISYCRSLSVHRLAVRYYELLSRQIQPCRRAVHFSREIHASLDELARKGRNEQVAGDAWQAAFRLHKFLEDGKNVNGFLSRNILHATGKASRDGLLFHYGIHHLHLSNETDADGFVKRSDYLLFAVVKPEDVFFVDVRRHPARGSAGWASQELLRIVHANWPELTERLAVRGIYGNRMTDDEVYELRRHNMNSLIDVGGDALMPAFCGTAMDGSIVLCKQWAGKLLQEVRIHEDFISNEEDREKIAKELLERGVEPGAELELELARFEELRVPPEQVDELMASSCRSRDLWWMGFAVVERRTRTPIAFG